MLGQGYDVPAVEAVAVPQPDLVLPAPPPPRKRRGRAGAGLSLSSAAPAGQYVSVPVATPPVPHVERLALGARSIGPPPPGRTPSGTPTAVDSTSHASAPASEVDPGVGSGSGDVPAAGSSGSDPTTSGAESSSSLSSSSSTGDKVVTSGLNILKLAELGAGASGRVYKAISVDTLTLVAAKVVPVFSQSQRTNMMKELRALYRNLQPPDMSSTPPCAQVVAFHDSFINTSESTVCMVVEYMDGGNLQGIIDAGGCPSESVLASMSLQLVKGIEFLHNTRQIHRDIKPANLLINHLGFVKVADMGITRDMGDEDLANTFVGTFNYMAPERITGETYSYASDIWSLGLSIMAVALGRFPFEHSKTTWMIMSFLRDNEVPPLPADRFSPQCIDFFAGMVIKDPEKRATVEQLLAHPFLAKASLPTAPEVDETQNDVKAARQEADDVIRTVMDYKYRAVRRKLKAVLDNKTEMSISELRKLGTLHPTAPKHLAHLANQLGVSAEFVAQRYSRKHRQAQQLLFKGVAAIAKLRTKPSPAP